MQQYQFIQRMVAVDLNGDGKLDLPGASSFKNAISVSLGNGDGTFQPEVDYPTATNPSDLVVRDFNGDGKLDIAAVCNGFVTVLLGNGDGTFQPHIDSAIDPGLHGWGAAAGDFNSDGKLDLVVGYQDPASNAVSVLLGKGDGTFQAPVDYATGSEPGAVTVADLNADGNLDIIAANLGSFGGNTVSVLLGNGDGTFQPQVQYQTSNGALSVIVADFNGDGKLDLAVDCACGNATTRCGYPGAVSILLGNGDGTFRAHVDYDVAAFPYTVSAGDYNGDGKLDLLVPDLDTAQVSLLHGNGDGTFGTAVLYGPTGPSPVGVAPGDFNGDGRLDAVIGTGGGFTTLLQATVAPTVVSYSVEFGSQTFNLFGSTRNRLPWQIIGITAVFSEPIATATTASLGGVTPLALSGVGTNTLTWTISPLVLGNFMTTLAGSGADAIKDAAGNPLAGGSGFSQAIKVLYGDFNDDGLVNSQDLVLVNNATAQPYNIFADVNGDSVVNATDVAIVRTRVGTSLP